jgi:DNA-binding Lrp family transcriptional regulator
MITTIILINAERKKINQAGTQLAAIDGVTEVYSVSGRFDLVAIIRHKSIEDISEIVTAKIAEVDGILKTESMIAYRMLSKYDVASLFDME